MTKSNLLEILNDVPDNYEITFSNGQTAAAFSPINPIELFVNDDEKRAVISFANTSKNN